MAYKNLHKLFETDKPSPEAKPNKEPEKQSGTCKPELPPGHYNAPPVIKHMRKLWDEIANLREQNRILLHERDDFREAWIDRKRQSKEELLNPKRVFKSDALRRTGLVGKESLFDRLAEKTGYAGKIKRLRKDGKRTDIPTYSMEQVNAILEESRDWREREYVIDVLGLKDTNDFKAFLGFVVNLQKDSLPFQWRAYPVACTIIKHRHNSKGKTMYFTEEEVKDMLEIKYLFEYSRKRLRNIKRNARNIINKDA